MGDSFRSVIGPTSSYARREATEVDCVLMMRVVRMTRELEEARGALDANAYPSSSCDFELPAYKGWGCKHRWHMQSYPHSGVNKSPFGGSSKSATVDGCKLEF
jgi:hypothetical protein